MSTRSARPAACGQDNVAFLSTRTRWLILAIVLGAFLSLSSMVLLSGGVVAEPPRARPAHATASLVGHWKLDEGAGTVAADSSGNGNHGTLRGNTAWITPTAPTGWPNPYALSFDGAGDFAEVPASATLTPATEFTVMAWVYLIHPEQSQKVVGSVQAELKGAYLLGVDKGKMDPEVWDSTGGYHRFQAGSIPTATWTHLALTWKTGGQMIGYVNGHRVGAIPASAKPIGVGNVGLVMGVPWWNHNVFCLNGALDDVRLYDRELSAAEIRAEASTCAATPNNGTDTYLTVQDAVDAALPGATIKVAGTCSGVQTRPTLNTGAFTATQLAVITKSLTVLGGYTPSDWGTANWETNPTTLDAQGLGRVMLITGTVTVTLHGLRITGGTATGLGGHKIIYAPDAAGGGLYIWGAKVGIAHCEIYSNTAWATPSQGWYGFGAGIYLDHADGTLLEGNWIAHNLPRPSGYGLGGAVYATRSDGLTVLDNVIEGNGGTTGNEFGGGLWLDHCNHSTIHLNIIRNNTSSRGPYVMSGGGGAWVEASNYVTITSNLVAGNSVGGGGIGGGGMYLFGVNHLRIAENEFSDNVAGLTGLSRGGGLYLDQCTDVSLTSNRFARNVAAPYPIENSWGGGAQITRGGSITLINNVFLGNQATTAGSALAISNTAALLVHTTFAGNSGGDGSALQVSARPANKSTASLVNTILFSHTVGITVGQGCTVTLQATLWQDTPTHWLGAGSASSTSDYVGDPRFGGDGYHLRAGSAALDKGIDAGEPTDIDGEPRPSGMGYDLGADEFWPGPTVYLPLVVRTRTYL